MGRLQCSKLQLWPGDGTAASWQSSAIAYDRKPNEVQLKQNTFDITVSVNSVSIFMPSHIHAVPKRAASFVGIVSLALTDVEAWPSKPSTDF
jgi:hypothetical protein